MGSARDRSEVSSPFRQPHIERGSRGLHRERRGAPRIPLLAMNRGPGSALEPVFGGSGRSLRFSEIEKFRDPIWRVSNLYSIRETWRKSDTLSATATAIAGPRHALPARAQANPYPQGAPDRFLDFAWRHLCGPALLATGKQVSLVDKTQEDARQKLKTSPCSPTTCCIRSLRIASW